MEGRTGRAFSRNKKARETLIGVDNSGTEYWLVPFKAAHVGNRCIELRQCSPNKKVPTALQGMITDAATATRIFDAWMDAESKKKSSSKKAPDGE